MPLLVRNPVVSAGNQPSRDLELALIEKIDSRLDTLAEDMRDVRERVIRIEAQDVSAKINGLEGRVKLLEEWKARFQGQVALIVVPTAAATGALIKFFMDVLVR